MEKLDFWKITILMGKVLAVLQADLKRLGLHGSLAML